MVLIGSHRQGGLGTLAPFGLKLKGPEHELSLGLGAVLNEVIEAVVVSGYFACAVQAFPVGLDPFDMLGVALPDDVAATGGSTIIAPVEDFAVMESFVEFAPVGGVQVLPCTGEPGTSNKAHLGSSGQCEHVALQVSTALHAPQ